MTHSESCVCYDCQTLEIILGKSPNLDAALHRFEKRLIEMALRRGQGHIGRTARILGIPNHQRLIQILDEKNGRHKDLAPLRVPAIKRRQSIIREEDLVTMTPDKALEVAGHQLKGGQ